VWLGVVNLAVPGGCAFCEADIEPEEGKPLFCETCVGLLGPEPWVACRCCGRPCDERRMGSPDDGCPQCRTQVYHFDGVTALGPYRDALRHAVLRMKRRTGDHLARAVGDLVFRRRADQLAALKPDVVVPVPMHWWRHMKRGTNSPEIVAARISRHLGVSFERAMLVRHHRTAPQAELSPTKRFENVRGAFRLRGGYAIKEARVLLVDDIMTTGATCSEASKVLKKAGAAAVFAAVVARTVDPTR